MLIGYARVSTINQNLSLEGFFSSTSFSIAQTDKKVIEAMRKGLKGK